jgi:FdhD protein
MNQNSKNSTVCTGEHISLVDMLHINSTGTSEKLNDYVVREQYVTIMADKIGSFAIMCTPYDLEALAIGFIYSEGMIDSIDDIVSISLIQEQAPIVLVQLENPSKAVVQRNLIVASSCGMCGSRNIQKMLTNMPACGQALEVLPELIFEIMKQLPSLQTIFQLTGGAHAAGIFTSSGEIIASAEDLGRHSAFDKVIGKCLLNRKSMRGCGVALSGRVSLEMVTKAARSGIELITAVSAPSSFAIEAARKWNITLCGFVRSTKLNVYTHSNRILSNRIENDPSDT